MMTQSGHRKGSAEGPSGNGTNKSSRLIIRFTEMYMYNHTLCSTSERYFSDIIGSCSKNSHVLFATVNRLTNPPAPLPLELISTVKCNEFAVFFNDKVQGIKNAINSTTQITHHPPRHLELTHFAPVADKTVQEIVTSLSSSTCCLDVLSTKFQLSSQQFAVTTRLHSSHVTSIWNISKSFENCGYQASPKEEPTNLKSAIFTQSP
ncbi:hypothetical protein NQD34_017490 [Periophthalmus magnuspinnatus]|nr:hypothetical protein NQD34_017490 [Periophthalmus magnuspinnatus]